MTALPESRRSSRRLATAAAAAVALTSTAVLVLARLTAGFDTSVDRSAWSLQGDSTRQLSRVLDLLAPAHVLVAAILVSAAWSVRTRSARPVALCAAISAAAAVGELGLKWTMPRVEGWLGGTGAAGFPSGHVVAALSFSGAALLAVRSEPQWWQWVAVVAAGVAMSALVLVTALHLPSDVAGAWALSWCVLATARALQPHLGGLQTDPPPHEG